MNTLLQALVYATPLVLVGCAPLDNPNDNAAGGPTWLPVEHERDGIVETWQYDNEVRLVAIDERVACRCVEEPRQLSRFVYSDRRAERAIDRDADGDDDEVQVVLRDALGRVTRYDRQLLDFDDQSLTFTYDAAGRLVGETDEDGAQRTAVRDAFGRVTTLLDDGVVFARYTWGDADLPTSIASGDDTTSYVYDDDGKLLEERSARPNNFDITSTYSYDDDGQLLRVEARNTDGTAAADVLTSTDYRYDDEGRLLSRVFVDHRTGAQNTMQTVYDEQGRPVQFTLESGEVASTSSMSYRTLDNGDVEVTTTDEGGARTTRFREFPTPARDDLALPSLYVAFPSVNPWFNQPFVEPN